MSRFLVEEAPKVGIYGLVSETELFLHGLGTQSVIFWVRWKVRVEGVGPKLIPKESTSNSSDDGW